MNPTGFIQIQLQDMRLETEVSRLLIGWKIGDVKEFPSGGSLFGKPLSGWLHRAKLWITINKPTRTSLVGIIIIIMFLPLLCLFWFGLVWGFLFCLILVWVWFFCVCIICFWCCCFCFIFVLFFVLVLFCFSVYFILFFCLFVCLIFVLVLVSCLWVYVFVCLFDWLFDCFVFVRLFVIFCCCCCCCFSFLWGGVFCFCLIFCCCWFCYSCRLYMILYKYVGLRCVGISSFK